MDKKGYLTQNGTYYASRKPVNHSDVEVPLKPGDDYWWDAPHKEWRHNRRSAQSIEHTTMTSLSPVAASSTTDSSGHTFSIKELVPILISTGLLLSSIFGVYVTINTRIVSLEKDLGYAREQMASMSLALEASNMSNTQLRLQINDLTNLLIKGSSSGGQSQTQTQQFRQNPQ